MKSKRVIVSFLIIVILIVINITSVSAYYYGNLTFTHGINNYEKSTFAITESAAIENSMQFIGIIHYFSGPYSGDAYYYTSPLKTYTKTHSQYLYPGSVEGASYFLYFVDDRCEHQSTAWWNFNFTDPI